MDAVRMGPLPFAYDVHTGLGVLIALLNEADSLLTRRTGRECRRVEREREWNARIIYQCHQTGPGRVLGTWLALPPHTPYAHPPAGNPELL